MTSPPSQDASSDAVDALRDEFTWKGRSTVLLASATVFLLTSPWFFANPTWILALTLWLGYCLAYAVPATLAKSLRQQRWMAVIELTGMSTLIGAAVGWGLEILMNPTVTASKSQLPYAWLYLTFCGMLMHIPLGQVALRQRALKNVEAERARLHANLQMLQAQIEPHFLFNTLATLRSLVRQRSNDALPLLDRMTNFLEAVIPQVRETHSTVAREINIVEQYLGIMSIRIGERFTYAIEVDAAIYSVSLPPLMLQPLVENAITHGIEPSETGGHITLRAEVNGQRLSFTICNSGAALGSTQTATGHGMALQNLRDRLRAHYGDHGDFILRSGALGTEAVISIPLFLNQHPA